MADHQGLALGAEGGVEADNLTQREGEHAVGESLDHVFLGSEGEPVQVRQRVEPKVGQLLAVAADVAAEADQQGLEALELHLFQLRAGHQFVSAIEGAHARDGKVEEGGWARCFQRNPAAKPEARSPNPKEIRNPKSEADTPLATMGRG